MDIQPRPALGRPHPHRRAVAPRPALNVSLRIFLPRGARSVSGLSENLLSRRPGTRSQLKQPPPRASSTRSCGGCARRRPRGRPSPSSPSAFPGIPCTHSPATTGVRNCPAASIPAPIRTRRSWQRASGRTGGRCPCSRTTATGCRLHRGRGRPGPWRCRPG